MEKTRLVVVCEELGGSNISVYINNPHADRKELLAMLTAHAVHFIRNMSLEDMPASDAVEMIETAIRIATGIPTDNEKGGESHAG